MKTLEGEYVFCDDKTELNHVLWTKYADKLYAKYNFKEEDCYTFMFRRQK